MAIKRREFLTTTTIAAGAALAAPQAIAQGQTTAGSTKVTPISRLKRMTDGIDPITAEERLARHEKARRLMVENKIDAVVIEGSTTLNYFTGVSWGLSERTFVWVLPARGEMAWVAPKFEEDRALELIKFGSDVRTWEEDESPYKVIAKALADRGLRGGRVGIEERLRFFIYDGLRQGAPGLEFVSADPVTVGCRSIKSTAEIALMQRANDITVEAYKAALAMLKEGMTKGDFSANAAAAFRALGVSGGIGASFGEQSSFPHGSIKPRTLREGDVILMDGGCGVEGYRSDVSRTIVFGKPTPKQRSVWELEQKAQLAAFAAAKPGATHESVDLAARRVIEAAGYGP
ncbi:MAG: Xaa-Pro peptidase family protein, partial [Candidatus Aminicenantes bacterium]|nr:Xaa-Pro peptidase family protein [Candidatus Aminicenantes bacterium]